MRNRECASASCEILDDEQTSPSHVLKYPDVTQHTFASRFDLVAEPSQDGFGPMTVLP